MSIYDFSASYDNELVSLSDYKGKVLLVVNTASKCGFTPQYEELEQLYKRLGNDKFEILAFPCNQFNEQEPGTNTEIRSFCKVNYGVSFTVFDKIEVKGKNAHPLFQYLCNVKSGLLGGAIKWNFTKFLVDSKGNVIDRFSPTTKPKKLEDKIIGLLEEVL